MLTFESKTSVYSLQYNFDKPVKNAVPEQIYNTTKDFSEEDLKDWSKSDFDNSRMLKDTRKGEIFIRKKNSDGTLSAESNAYYVDIKLIEAEETEDPIPYRRYWRLEIKYSNPDEKNNELIPNF